MVSFRILRFTLFLNFLAKHIFYDTYLLYGSYDFSPALPKIALNIVYCTHCTLISMAKLIAGRIYKVPNVF
jgi:hypothetical protein